MYIVQDGLPFKDKLERDAPNLIEGYLLDVAFTNMFNLKQKEKRLVHRYKVHPFAHAHFPQAFGEGQNVNQNYSLHIYENSFRFAKVTHF
jgi:hypothetical protein